MKKLTLFFAAVISFVLAMAFTSQGYVECDVSIYQNGPYVYGGDTGRAAVSSQGHWCKAKLDVYLSEQSIPWDQEIDTVIGEAANSAVAEGPVCAILLGHP